LKTYKFDGFDIDWEYPAQRGGVKADVANLISLIKELRTEFNKFGYILSAAVPVTETSFTQSYDVPQLSQYVDFINVMAYDFHGGWENKLCHNAPLYRSRAELGTYEADFNVVSPEKIILGIPLYGISFTMSSTSCFTPRCGARAPGYPQPFTSQSAFLGYNEVHSNNMILIIEILNNYFFRHASWKPNLLQKHIGTANPWFHIWSMETNGPVSIMKDRFN
jgi:chitinase